MSLNNCYYTRMSTSCTRPGNL